MDTKASNFQIIILVVFSFFVLAGIVLFATNTIGKKSGGLAPVVMWGTLPSSAVQSLIESIPKGTMNMTYVEKDPSVFEKDLVEALANGEGPDMIVLPQDLAIRSKNKIFTIPFTSYPLRSYKDDFVDASDVFLLEDGEEAVPFAVDPLVMYWNKTHFINASIVNPPQTWDEFNLDVAKLTKKDSNYNVTQSGVAMGSFDNVNHAKDIISSLLLQIGVSIAERNSTGYKSTLTSNGYDGNNISSVLSFYTSFANPAKDSYSWNNSLPSSFDSFVANDTSVYFGYASDLQKIVLKNPNLNFDVASFPQIKNGVKQVAFGKIYGIAILKSSKNLASAFTQILSLTNTSSIKTLASLLNLPPVRKDVLAQKPTDPYTQVFYDAALRAHSWPDPDPYSTDIIFREMVGSSVTGKEELSDIITRASARFDSLFNNQK